MMEVDISVKCGMYTAHIPTVTTYVRQEQDEQTGVVQRVGREEQSN